MKFNYKKNREVIITRLCQAKSLDDLVVILNNIQELYLVDNPHFIHMNKPVTSQLLKYIVYGKEKRYHQFQVAKKSGGIRTITAPSDAIKNTQRLLNIALQCLYTPTQSTTGFVIGKSIVDNANRHVNKKYVYNIDLQDFFSSIQFTRIRGLLGNVELPNKWLKSRVLSFASEQSIVLDKLVLNPDVAHYIANLCCFEGVLPQGAPTSPTVSNMVCKVLDYKLYKLSEKYGLTFTRYADDITFSTNKPAITSELKAEIFAIIRKEGFELNEAKERIQVYGKELDGKLNRERQMVTGIVVNKKANVSKRYIRNLKAAIYNWEKHGYAIASNKHESFYVNEKGFLRYNGNVPKMELVIGGKLEFLGMVRGRKDTTYRLLKLRFDQLCKKEHVDTAFLNEILDLWDEKGLKRAIDRMYNRQKNVVIEEE